MKLIATILLAMLALGPGPVLAQEKKAAAPAKPAAAPAKPAADASADNMQIFRDKIAADKKVVVAAAMDLTESEAKGFWPVYEAYQKDLHKINDGIATVISDYAKAYNAKSLTDDRARKLMDRYLALEDEELKLRRAVLPKLSKALPGMKVVRYVQLENKVRALVKYELASEIPLVQ